MLLCSALWCPGFAKNRTSPQRQDWAELTEQSRRACLVKGLVRDEERTSVFRHINLLLSVKGKEKKFRVPGLCSVIPSLTSGSPNLADSLMGLLLLPLKTFDISLAENTPRFVKRSQVEVFLFGCCCCLRFLVGFGFLLGFVLLFGIFFNLFFVGFFWGGK